MKLYQVDAFTDHVFGGNPAAVIPLKEWLTDDKMQRIAMENNLSETAFFVKEGDFFHIRWFTPVMEVDLCGHATLASAHVIFNHMKYEEDIVQFKYTDGWLSVRKEKDLLNMDFPSSVAQDAEISDLLIKGLGKKPILAKKARDLMVLFKSEEDILNLDPDFAKLAQIDHLGVIATAPGEKADFVSRYFGPRAGINEDPVTGSAHCMLVPFWAERLNKNIMYAVQLSKRLGHLHCEYKNDRVLISGHAVTYLTGEIQV
jgi:PhzF family phenazine biosynthesis protein